MSSVITSGRAESSISNACRPSSAAPTTFMPGVALTLSVISDRTTAESSTTRTRISSAAIANLPRVEQATVGSLGRVCTRGQPAYNRGAWTRPSAVLRVIAGNRGIVPRFVPSTTDL
jgi:hypothetical protein